MAFMVPIAEFLTAKEAREYTGDAEAKKGWYSRLSAPGYLDCTDWQGPYATEVASIREVCEQYDYCPECLDEIDSEGNCQCQ